MGLPEQATLFKSATLCFTQNICNLKEGRCGWSCACLCGTLSPLPCLVPLLLLLSSLGSEKEEMLPCSATLAARYSAVSALLWVGVICWRFRFFISHLCMDVCASWVFVHDYKTSSWLVIPTWYICTFRCDRQLVTMGGWFYYRFLDLVHDCLTHGVHLTKSYRRPRRRDNYPIVLSALVWQCNTGPAFIAVGLLKVRLGTVAIVSTQI